jgi:DNA-binding LacI/PurR family transcriptional regulator
VLADDRTGMRRGVEHLLQLRHYRLAYANARATYLAHDSIAVRRDTLVSVSDELVLVLFGPHDTPFADGFGFLGDAVVGERATAVITYDHVIAVTLVGTASELGLEIPMDFSLVSARQLLNSLASQAPSASKEIRLPENHAVRRSTPPRADRYGSDTIESGQARPRMDRTPADVGDMLDDRLELGQSAHGAKANAIDVGHGGPRVTVS